MAYPIATICGTMKLYQQMLTVAAQLTLDGAIVLMPFVHKAPTSLADHPNHNAEFLDAMHREKIRMSELVVVVTDFTDHLMVSDSHDLYFGESTTAEMKYASELGLPIKLARVQRCDYRDTIVWLDVDGGESR